MKIDVAVNFTVWEVQTVPENSISVPTFLVLFASWFIVIYSNNFLIPRGFELKSGTYIP